MKYLILAIIGFGSYAASANIGPAGCGLGHQFFGGKDSQVIASTTNSSSYTNVFGITSGTSGCVDSSGNAKLETFIEGNKQALSTEAARGEGETLASVAQILKCVNPTQMGEVLKNNHDDIFASEATTDISSKMRSVLAREQVTCLRGS